MLDDYDSIFTAYYQMFRGESSVPASTDDEYIMGITFANRAIQRWANYDGTYWKELYETLQNNGTGDQTITTGDVAYTCPTNMREPGGLVFVKDSDGNTVRTYPIIEPEERQFQDANATYAYFTGNPTAGFTLRLNPAPEAEINGFDIDYTYYKKATDLTTGTSTTEVPNLWFVVHDMLAQRFQIERNYGGYQIAKRDAEEFLKNMQQDNNSGSWANPWSMKDNSGSVFGV